MATDNNQPPASLGPTGQFPDGKLSPDDEGELRFAIGENTTSVIINFGTPIASIAMSPEQAVKFAGTMIAHARSVANKTGKSLTIRI